MRALTLVGWGLLVVLLDLRFDGFDVVMDPVGWAMVVAGLGRLRHRHPGLATARAAAMAAGVVSVVQVVLALANPIASAWVSVAEALLDLAVVVPLCTAVASLLADHDPRRARTVTTIRTAEIVLTVVLLPVAVWGAMTTPPGSVESMTTVDAGWLTVPGIALVLAGLGVRVWLLVLLFQAAPQVDGEERPVAGSEGAQPLVP